MNWYLIFNPFSRFSEKQLFLTGVLATFLGSLIAYYLPAEFAGILDVKSVKNTTLKSVFLQNIFNVVFLSIALFGLGKVLNSKTRFVDILNIALTYRIVIYIFPLLGYSMLPKDLDERIISGKQGFDLFNNPLEMILAGTFGILAIVILAYVFVLLFNGFKTATNIKKWQHYTVFGFSILFIEIISEIIFYYLFKN